MPHQGLAPEPWLDSEGVQKLRADHEVLGVDSFAMEVDELLGEVLGIVIEVHEVILREGQQEAPLHNEGCPPRYTTRKVTDDNMTRGDHHFVDSGYDALEDLDLVRGLVCCLVLECQAILINA